MFPLQSVLFPSAVLPMQVFEPRFLQLVDDVLAGDRRFGVVLITRGSDVGGGEERASVGTVAKVVRVGALDDGRLTLVALGEQRVKVVDWLPDAPYPEDRAAVHHLLEEGWMYLLGFDHGTTSAGLMLDPVACGALDVDEPAEIWSAVIRRYPTLSALFEEAEAERPIEFRPRAQHRLAAAHGPRWVAMPHTFGFIDPLFSVGIAWSLRGVERLAETLLELGPEGPGVVSGRAFERYGRLVADELEQIDRLVATAYRARRRLDLFAAHSMLYWGEAGDCPAISRRWPLISAKRCPTCWSTTTRECRTACPSC